MCTFVYFLFTFLSHRWEVDHLLCMKTMPKAIGTQMQCSQQHLQRAGLWDNKQSSGWVCGMFTWTMNGGIRMKNWNRNHDKQERESTERDICESRGASTNSVFQADLNPIKLNLCGRKKTWALLESPWPHPPHSPSSHSSSQPVFLRGTRTSPGTSTCMSPRKAFCTWKPHRGEGGGETPAHRSPVRAQPAWAAYRSVIHFLCAAFAHISKYGSHFSLQQQL